MGATPFGRNACDLTRRALCRWVIAAPIGCAGGVVGLHQALAQNIGILAVSRKRLLHETAHAQMLHRAEIELTAELQRRVDLVKADLNAQEEELARLRRSLDRTIFERRVAQFDKRVRDERRRTQQHATSLQNAFRAERLKLVEALDPLLESVRAAWGVPIIVNGDNVLASDPSIDITAEVILRFNAEVAPPVIPDLDDLAPRQPASSDGQAAGESDDPVQSDGDAQAQPKQ